MVSYIKSSEINSVIIHRAKTVGEWFGKHKVETAGVILTTALVAAIIATSVATFGITAIIAGGVLGGGVLFAGVGTAVYGINKMRTESAVAAKAAKDKAAAELVRKAQFDRYRKIYCGFIGAQVLAIIATVGAVAHGIISPTEGMGVYYAFGGIFGCGAGAILAGIPLSYFS